MVCTFFGHRMICGEIEPKLKELLVDLIENHNADKFYVGNQGDFDRTAKEVLIKLKEEYPHISYNVVLAYLPTKRDEWDERDYSDTIYPDCLETTPPRFAIDRRNKWMLKQADTVITYVRTPVGGAAQYKYLAEKKGKQIFNLA